MEHFKLNPAVWQTQSVGWAAARWYLSRVRLIYKQEGDCCVPGPWAALEWLYSLVCLLRGKAGPVRQTGSLTTQLWPHTHCAMPMWPLSLQGPLCMVQGSRVTAGEGAGSKAYLGWLMWKLPTMSFFLFLSHYEAHISVSPPLCSRDSRLVENVFKTELRADK